MYGSDPRRGGGGPPGGTELFGVGLQIFCEPLLQNFMIVEILSANLVDWHNTVPPSGFLVLLLAGLDR